MRNSWISATSDIAYHSGKYFVASTNALAQDGSMKIDY
jgi:hypothetical protein